MEVGTIFNSYEFSFGGESSLMYGLMIYDFDGKGQNDVSFGNKADIVETRTNNRIQPIHFGVNYHKTPLQFKLIFGSDKPLDRYDLENISFWLTGHQRYQWLSIDQPDMELFQFRCLITQLTPLSHGWLPVAFEATILCDCPYAYGHEFYNQYAINGTTNILFRNESSIREPIKPYLTFSPSSGTTELKIINHSDNDRTFILSSLPTSSGMSIKIDNLNGIITESVYGYNLYEGFNLNLFRLVQGDNSLTISGNGTLALHGRLQYNIAG